MSNDVEFYERDGKRYDRVTRILDYFAPPELVDWKIRVGKREAGMISRAALRIGENVDERIRAMIDGDGEHLPKLKTLEAKNCWEAFESWLRNYAPDIDERKLSTESTVFNDHLGVAGTPDLCWNVHTVIDVKCSSAIRESYWLQTEFYGRNMPCVKNKAVLRLDKNLGIYEFKMMSLNDEHWETVKAAVRLFRYYNPVNHGGKETHECNADRSAGGTDPTDAT